MRDALNTQCRKSSRRRGKDVIRTVFGGSQLGDLDGARRNRGWHTKPRGPLRCDRSWYADRFAWPIVG